MIFEAEDFSKVLNRADYAQSLHDYDRDQLEQYVAVVNQVTELKKNLEAQKAELEAQKAELETQKASLKARKPTWKASRQICRRVSMRSRRPAVIMRVRLQRLVSRQLKSAI